MNALLIILIILMLAVLAVLAVLLRRLVPHAQGSGHTQLAVLSEKVSQLEPVSQTVNDIRLNLAELQAHLMARQDIEHRTAESIRRLEMVIAGTQSKGTAGENILEAVFAKLPAEWQVRGFQVGNKTVEFGLRLPNNLVLPIDSKWPATNLLQQFALTEEIAAQQKLKRQVETKVLEKVKEVRKYLNPNLTTSFGVAVIPDAAFDVCTSVHVEAFRSNVVVLSYSMFVPYLLLVYQTALESSQTVDLQRLNTYLKSVEEAMEVLQGELQGRFTRAITMLNNSREDMTAQLSSINGSLMGLKLTAPTSDSRRLTEPEEEN